MIAAPLVLIDLASIIHPTFHMSASEPDPNWTNIQTVARVRALASGQPHVVICCDAPPYLRKDIDPTYKANRPESDATLRHQIALAVETLRGDGFPVWAVKGYEADDVIASATDYVLAHTAWEPTTDADVLHARSATKEIPDAHVIIVSADKDLLQLVGPRVSVKSLRDGSIIDADAVKAKFGVRPDQIADYLCLVGDASDNIKGAKGIGEKKAAALLAAHGTLAALMTPEVANAQTPGIRAALEEFAGRVDTVRQLIALRTDVPVPIEEAFAPRVAQETSMDEDQRERDKFDAVMHAASAPRQTSEADTSATKGAGEEPESRVDRAVESGSVESQGPQPAGPQQALVPQVMPAPAPAEWTMQLEPRSIDDAWRLAQRMHESRLFSAYGTPSAVLSTIMAGRELAIPSMSSLRLFHIIGGKPSMSADMIRGLVQKSPLCEYFICTERTPLMATWRTKRRGDPQEVSLTYTIEQGRAAWEKDQKAWDASAWGKRPVNMVTKSSSSELARLVYADVVGNMYSVEELTGEERS